MESEYAQALFPLAAVIIVSGTIGIAIAATLHYMAADDLRWDRFVGFFESLFDNRLTRPVFSTLVGPAVARIAIHGYARQGKFQRARDLAVSEGLVDEAIDFLEEQGHPREAGRLALRMARTGRAAGLYRAYIDACLRRDDKVLAAEAAEEGGFIPEAVGLLRSMEARNTRLHAARLAADHGEPDLAIEIYLEEEALLDAMGVAQEAGRVDFVLSYCRASTNPVLHHFGADAARRAGKAKTGVEILFLHGHLHAAVRLARSSGLEDEAEALGELIRMRRVDRSRDRLSGRRGGPFGFDYSDDVLTPS